MICAMRVLAADAPCPCGGGAHGDCCGPLLNGGRAWTAEVLMRSRYTAFVLDNTDHLWRTWHPSTRPRTVHPSGNHWMGLRIIDVVDGNPGDLTGIVEFEAVYRGSSSRTRIQHERSLFEYRANRWMYVAAE